jgi:hypothetical protein
MASVNDWAAKAARKIAIECDTATGQRGTYVREERIAAIIETFARPLLDVLHQSRREHLPAADKYCNKRYDERDECTCGADEWNAKIDAALAGSICQSCLSVLPSHLIGCIQNPMWSKVRKAKEPYDRLLWICPECNMIGDTAESIRHAPSCIHHPTWDKLKKEVVSQVCAACGEYSYEHSPHCPNNPEQYKAQKIEVPDELKVELDDDLHVAGLRKLEETFSGSYADDVYEQMANNIHVGDKMTLEVLDYEVELRVVKVERKKMQ